MTNGLGSFRPLKCVTLRSGPSVTLPSTKPAAVPAHLLLCLSPVYGRVHRNACAAPLPVHENTDQSSCKSARFTGFYMIFEDCPPKGLVQQRDKPIPLGVCDGNLQKQAVFAIVDY